MSVQAVRGTAWLHFSCLRFGLWVRRRAWRRDSRRRQTKHGRVLILDNPSISRFGTSFIHSWPFYLRLLCPGGVFGSGVGVVGPNNRHLDQASSSSSSKQAGQAKSSHPHRLYTRTGYSTTRSSMSRMIRKGLDTLGKALRETGQALDRAGLEALGTEKHKELCKYSCAFGSVHALDLDVNL